MDTQNNYYQPPRNNGGKNTGLIVAVAVLSAVLVIRRKGANTDSTKTGNGCDKNRGTGSQGRDACTDNARRAATYSGRRNNVCRQL